MILSLGRFGIASPETTKALEKEWSRYRKENGLDLYGKAAEAPAKAPACSH